MVKVNKTMNFQFTVFVAGNDNNNGHPYNSKNTPLFLLLTFLAFFLLFLNV